MESILGGLAIVAIIVGFMPAVRGVAAGINSFEEPDRQETPQERERANSDMRLLLFLLVVVAGAALVALQG